MSKARNWDELYEQATTELKAWRARHQQATLTEIEENVDATLAVLRARMIEELALASELRDITQLEKEARPSCPHCGQPLVANGRKRRRLVTEYEQEIELERSRATCPSCGGSIFPPG